MKPGDHVVLLCDIPPRAGDLAGGNIAKAKTAYVAIYRDHPETKVALTLFGLEEERIIATSDSLDLSLHYRCVKETTHTSQDATGFLGGVWKDIGSAILRAKPQKKPWWKVW